MIVNVVSDSVYFPKGHGVHTAFLNQIEMLRENGITVRVNSLGRADITHIHTLGALGLTALLKNHPAVVTAHVIPESFVGSLVGAKYWGQFSTRYMKSFYNKADAVIAVAPAVKERLTELDITSPIHVFPNPINSSVFKKDESLRKKGRELLRIHDGTMLAISSGQIQDRKGVADFIEIARQHPDMSFLWLGGEPFKALNDQSSELTTAIRTKPKNVSLPGIIPYKDMPLYYNAADLYLFPSYQENAPMGPIEAAACGLPLLLRDLPEYALLYKEGYLKAKSNAEFSNLLTKCAQDKAFYRDAASDAQTLASHYSFPSLFTKIETIYNSMLKS